MLTLANRYQIWPSRFPLSINFSTLLIFTPRLYSQIDLHIKVRERKAFALIGKKKIRKEWRRELTRHKQRATNTWAAPWVHGECHGCSRYGGCSPGTGRVLLERTAPTAGVCRRAVEGRTGPPGCTFPAAPWQRDNTPLPAASSRATTKSPLPLSAPPGKWKKKKKNQSSTMPLHSTRYPLFGTSQSPPHLPCSLVRLCLECEGPVRCRCV